MRPYNNPTRSYVMKFYEASVKGSLEMRGAAQTGTPPFRMGIIRPHLLSV